MNLSVEILDHIFSFLVSDRTTLIACSKDPVLSHIVERHLYYIITVGFDALGRGREHSDSDFTSAPLSSFVSENPQILYHVRILRIRVALRYFSDILDQFATTLLMFPVLECIQLITPQSTRHDWPDVFRPALKDRLALPTLKEVHMVGRQDFRCSLIDNCQNIENLLLSGSYLGTECRPCISTFPQLRSLTSLSSLHESFLASLKPHLKELRSLKCAVKDLPELLEVCSRKLTMLDIDLFHTSCKLQPSSDG
jgi:hypothetical protein